MLNWKDMSIMFFFATFCTNLCLLIFFWYFECSLWTEWPYWHDSFKFLSDIIWYIFRVPTRGSLVPNVQMPEKRLKYDPKGYIFKNTHVALIFSESMCCGYRGCLKGILSLFGWCDKYLEFFLVLTIAMSSNSFIFNLCQ